MKQNSTLFRTFTGMRYLYLLTFSGCLLALFSCKKPQDPESPVITDPAEYYTAKDVSYGSHPQQKMDIYLPAGRNAYTKTLLLIHGGGWAADDKSDMAPFIDEQMMADLNLALVNINYRLATATEFKHPAQMDDIALALDFLQQQAQSYSINPDTFVLAGASAGGHLSLLYDYGFDNANRIHAVINLVGPTNFVTRKYLRIQLCTLPYGGTWAKCTGKIWPCGTTPVRTGMQARTVHLPGSSWAMPIRWCRMHRDCS